MASVSVIMSTYCRNRAATGCPNLLRRAIDSVLSQTFKDFEFILIDDGSKDGSEAVCREYAAKDNRIRYVRHDDNCGLPAVRYNEGMLIAKSDYFMFMFDDDMWFPKTVSDLHWSITKNNKDCGMVYGKSLWDYNGIIQQIGQDWDLVKQDTINVVPNLAVIVKREVINTVGGYDESETFRRLCDWDLWWRVGHKFKVVCIQKVVAQVSTQPDGLQSNNPLNTQAIKEAQRNPNRVVALQGKLVNV